MDIERALSKIEFYQKHSEYKPFVGKDYDKHKILLVGESHFIGQTPGTEQFSLEYFEKHWWNGTCDDLHKAFRDGYYTTRTVISNYENDGRTPSHGIFTNCVKSFSDVVLGEPIPHITLEESKKIEYFAFMNFFQMPSLYKGKKFWNSLMAASHEKASASWKKAVAESSKVLDAVIDVLHPQLVIFVSKYAYDAYSGIHKADSNVRRTCHPACSHWNKPRKSDGHCGREDFEDLLRHFIVNKGKK